MRRRDVAGVIATVVFACLFGAGVRPARAQTASDLFDAGTLQEMRLFINTKDLALLRARYTENTKYPADLLWRNTRVRNVAVNSRGSGSRNPTKLGISVDFSHYTTGQTFLGLTSLVLDNAYQDRSLMREQVAMSLFAKMGIAVPRESFCRFYINGEYQGLYVIVENIDTNFLTRTLGQNSGYLFEFRWQNDPSKYFYANDLGDDVAAYKPLFEPRTHTLETDSAIYSPIRDLFREVNGPDDAVWRSRVAQYIDVTQFMRLVAVEIFLAEYDGLTGNWGMNNFYLYRRGGANLHDILPWDRDYAFIGQFDSSIFLNTAGNVLFQRAMTYTDLRDKFFQTLEDCANTAAQDGWLEQQIARSAALITGPAHDDTRKQFDNEKFDAEILFLTDFAQRRSAYVLQEVAKARGGSE